MPGPERRAARAPGAPGLVAAYDRWLEADGRGSRCYRDGAWAFLGRWLSSRHWGLRSGRLSRS